ncbi:MAG: hypothetical protein V5A68_04825 [Candidatus Thermoplasmatota archaeon]
MGYDIEKTSDDGYIVCGYSSFPGINKGLLVKTDDKGNEKWNKTFLIKGNTHFFSVEQTADDKFIVAGRTYDTFNVTYIPLFLKVNTKGDIIWKETYNSEEDKWATSVKQTEEGGYILSGITDTASPDTDGAFLIKTDDQGRKIWSKTYPYPSKHESEWMNKVVKSNDGGYVIAGAIRKGYHGKTLSFLMKTDKQGKLLWNKTYEIGERTSAYDITPADDGGFALTGRIHLSDEQNSKTFVIKTDNKGIIEWNKIYDIYDRSGAYSIQQTSDGGFIIGGMLQESDKKYSLLLKIDNTGNQCWNKKYTGQGEMVCVDVIQDNNKGFVLTDITSEGSGDVFLLKTTSNGDQL